MIVKSGMDVVIIGDDEIDYVNKANWLRERLSIYDCHTVLSERGSATIIAIVDPEFRRRFCERFKLPFEEKKKKDYVDSDKGA